MRTVFTATSAIERICGFQKYNPNEEYRLTTCCVKVRCNDGILLYHTLTGALYLLENEEELIKHREEFIKNRFLVPQSFDEKKYVTEVKSILSLLRPHSERVTSFTILTTTDCNARCFYCYELNSRRLTMDDTVASDIADYINKVSAGDDVSITWFGGEPLYNSRAIDVITSRLNELGKKFTSRIITNAYLFDIETVHRAVENWHLKNAQITIDGTKERYQKTKSYIYHDNNAYERVLDNIDALLENGIKVSVRLNMNKENADDLIKLSDELSERFADRKGLTVYPILLKEFVGSVNAFESDIEAYERISELRRMLLEKGFLHTTPLVREIAFQRCMADNDACEVIMPDGSIGKCEHFSESEIIGSIYSDDRDTALAESWKEQVFDPSCGRCPLLPRCMELKKCAWSKDGCSDRVRMLRTEKLKGQILSAYLEQKESLQ